MLLEINYASNIFAIITILMNANCFVWLVFAKVFTDYRQSDMCNCGSDILMAFLEIYIRD